MNNQDGVRYFVAEPVQSSVRQAIERMVRAPDVLHVAIMPDVHPGVGASNGVVVATRSLVYPAAVGGDIGCGFATVMCGGTGTALARRNNAEAILQALPSIVPIIRHRRRDDPPSLTDELDPNRLSTAMLATLAANEGRLELGSLGRGNHFLEFQHDSDDRIWIMVHSGSRAMGQHITAFHHKRATAAGGGLAWLDASTEVGQAYLRDMEWARRYAAASRRRMLDAAARLLSELLGLATDWTSYLNTDHNHVQVEEHYGEKLFVHRKGANSADVNAPNLIPGSMATHTYHVEGRAHRDALRSSSHGAGRRLSRGAARARSKRNDVERELADVWVDPKIVSRLSDETPSAYKDLDAVMRAQRELVRIVRKVKPVVCYKGI